MVELKKIDQRYDVIKTLGGGFSGEVILVTDPEGHRVALKFLKKVQLNISRTEAVENFKREVSILQGLDHPHIARFIDFGYDPKIQRYYYTSEFIEGSDINEACQGQPLALKEKLIVQTLKALDYLHSRGIYHFDIKPQNILVEIHKGSVLNAKLIDFGLAGIAPPQKQVGTPAYMAPEVITKGALDGRTDLYAAGVLIYKILSGINPFASKKLQETFHKHQHVVPEEVSKINLSIPHYWDQILSRLLAKDPNMRYPRAAAVISDLRSLSEKES